MLNRPITQAIRLSYIDPAGDPVEYSVPMTKKTPWYVVATRLRKEQGITLQQMGDRLGYAKSTVGHWLTGHNPAPFSIIKEIAVLLGTTEITLIADDPFYIDDVAERELIEKYRALPEDQRALAYRLMASALDTLTPPSDPTAQPNDR